MLGKKGLTKKEKNALVKEYYELIEKKEAVNRALVMGNLSNRTLILWYNGHSELTWTKPNELAFTNLMDIELELLYRGME